MRIKILEYANESNVNKECEKLENKGFIIIDIVYTHQTYSHYVNYATIKYTKKQEKEEEAE